MKAVVEQELDGKIPTSRSIVDEVAKIEGHSNKHWIKARYWTLKREFGWRYARLLMWWNDPNIASEEELLLAVEQLEVAKNDGIISQGTTTCGALFDMRTQKCVEVRMLSALCRDRK